MSIGCSFYSSAFEKTAIEKIKQGAMPRYPCPNKLHIGSAPKQVKEIYVTTDLSTDGYRRLKFDGLEVEHTESASQLSGHSGHIFWLLYRNNSLFFILAARVCQKPIMTSAVASAVAQGSVARAITTSYGKNLKSALCRNQAHSHVSTKLGTIHYDGYHNKCAK
jgi:hypothetical protein